MTTKTTYKVGDKVRILNAEAILCANGYRDGDITEIIRTPAGGIGIESRTADYPVRLLDGELKYIEKVAEQVAKFKVGDKVEVVSEVESGYGKGVLTVTEGQRGFACGGNYTLDDKYIVLGDNTKHATQKPTKNQRITTLEQEVEALKAEVEALKATQSIGKTAEAIVKAIEKHTPKSPNEQRKAIITEAKAFVETKTHYMQDSSVVNGGKEAKRRENPKFSNWLTKVEFIVNAEKRTVVAIVRNMYGDLIREKAIAKCAPDDVFNADIGKAIALGRALGLDAEQISKFEQAVQPTEFEVGQIALCGYGKPYTIAKVLSDRALTKPGSFHWKRELREGIVKISDDTEAQY